MKQHGKLVTAAARWRGKAAPEVAAPAAAAGAAAGGGGGGGIDNYCLQLDMQLHRHLVFGKK